MFSFLVCSAAGGQPAVSPPVPVGADITTVAADTAGLAATDSTARMWAPSLIGSYDRWLDSARVFTTDERPWLNHRYIGDLLSGQPGVFIVSQGSEGQYNQPVVLGQDWRSVAVTFNGRSMNDPVSGIHNLYHVTSEYADRIEFVSGPRAFLYGLNAAGASINIVTRNYNSNRPLSRLNYSESGYNYSYTDGTFSQNISRRVNVTVGFQQQSTDGRFLNSAHEHWNVRAKIRYNLTRDINIILSEYYTQTQTQLNGGINTLLSPGTNAFNPILAVPVNSDSYEKTRRHDVDLTLAGTLLNDTTNLSMLTFYYSNYKREYRDEENRRGPNGVFIQSDHISSWMGAMFTQNLDTDFQRFSLGSTLEVRQIEASPNLNRRRNVLGSVWAKEEFLVGRVATIAGFARYDQYLRKSYTSYGADAKISVVDAISLTGGFSVARRLPTYQELYWSDSTVSRGNPILAETHRQVEMGGKLTFELFKIRASYFHRTVTDPIRVKAFHEGTVVFPGVLFENGGDVVTNGVTVAAEGRTGVIAVELSGMFLTQRAEADIEHYPRLSGRGGVYYRDRILNGNLDLKVGFQGRYASSHLGLQFNPEVIAYVPNSTRKLGYGSAVDFVMMGKIGDASIHLIWENLTGSQFFLAPFHPVQDRQVRFGITWQFLD